MTRVLLTGMSGTGKSAAIAELAARGFRAVDLDAPDWSCWIEADPSDGLTPAAGKDWVWREDRVRALLRGAGERPLFLSGCASNMATLYDEIDLVILLSAPIETIMARLATRIEGYGRSAEERAKVEALIGSVEPLLRKRADLEIDTRGPVGDCVDGILSFVQRRG